MIQGTASNAGKSILATGLCRIFKQDGYSVAPFKSQNMALNSFITKEGLEMGRAQVVQAEAAGIEPLVDMNPILLKPTGDSKSQVVLQGEVFDDLNAVDYYSYKRIFAPKIKESFDRLSSKHDIIVIEGAGSPAEINLRDNDIVNMYMARLANAPVLIVADIDRGGVFASLAGTMLLFTEEEKRYVKGFIINKFRGDKSLLDPGLRQLEEITKRAVLGVVPYIKLDIEDEDSLSEKLDNNPVQSKIKICVVRLPRMSNFTDFNVLSREKIVSLCYANKPEMLNGADLVIIPGTKNTMSDLLWMRKTGMESAVREYAAMNKPLFGICGGYQILGKRIFDPENAEGGGELEGMGLLPVNTVFSTEKKRTQVCGEFLQIGGVLKNLTGMKIEGYEVHMGRTEHAGECKTTAALKDTVTSNVLDDGAHNGNIYGTYTHGIFDAQGISQTIVKALCEAKGIDYNADAETSESDIELYKEKQYDLLAEVLRANIDIKTIYKIMGLE